jgi:hypothetical protein
MHRDSLTVAAMIEAILEVNFEGILKQDMEGNLKIDRVIMICLNNYKANKKTFDFDRE